MRRGCFAGRARMLAVPLLIVAAVGFSGCVGREKHDVDRAREALAECEVEYGRAHRKCEPARRRLKDAQQRYENAARKAWSCDPVQEECPTQR